MKKEQLKKIPPTKKPSLEREDKSNRFYDLLGLAIIILLGIIIYSNSFDCSFHFDDFKNIVDNKKIPNLSDFEGWWNFNKNRVVTFYSFALNIHFNQFSVWGYHLVNLMIHLINACLVWWLTLLIFSCPALKGQRIARHKKNLALLTALLFVSHPLATQSVTYIVQRLASLVAMFYLLSIALYLKARLTDARGISKHLLFTGSILSALLAMFTKENAFTLPFAILLVEFFLIHTKKFAINFKDHRVILLIAGLIGFIILITLKFSFSIFKPVPPTQLHSYTLTVYGYFLTQFSVIVKYIQLLLLPINQMVDYDFPFSNNFFDTRTLLSFLLLSGLIIVAISLFKKYRTISFGIFWFFLTLSIESSFIPINDLIFEHRTYLPSFGFFLILSSGVFVLLWEKYKLVAMSIFALIIVSNSYLTFERNKVWKNELNFWSDNVKKAPNLARPIFNRGYANMKLRKLDKAIDDFNKAIIINPNYANPYFNRGYIYGNLQQKRDKALLDYSRAIEIDPNYSEAYNNRGVTYGALQQWDKAISDCSRAIELNPNYADAYSNRGNVFASLGLWEKSIDDYSNAIKINPDFADAYFNRGFAYGNLEKWNKAIEDYNKTIEIDPNIKIAYTQREIAFKNLENQKSQ